MSGGCEMRKTFSFDKFPFILIMHFHFQAKCEYNRLNFKLLMATQSSRVQSENTIKIKCCKVDERKRKKKNRH